MKKWHVVLFLIGAFVAAAWLNESFAGPPDNRPPGGIDNVSADAAANAVSKAFADASSAANAAGGSATANGSVTASPNFDSDTLAIALANQLGGVDIGDCIASKQWATPIFSKQGFDLNPWCAAEAADSRGLHTAAARIRCTIKSIRGLYDSDAACMAEWKMTPVAAYTAPEPAPYAEVSEELEKTQQALSGALRRISEVEEATKQKVAPVVRQEIRQPALTASQRAALMELKGSE